MKTVYTYDEIALISHKVAMYALECTTHIFKIDGLDITPMGGGIFMSLNDHKFLISAGHLLNLEDTAMLNVPGTDFTMSKLKGILTTTHKSHGFETDADYAIFRFDEQHSKTLDFNRHNFLPYDKLGLNHDLRTPGYYVVAGNPNNSIKKLSGRSTYIQKPMWLTTPVAHKEMFDKNGFNARKHILVRDSGKRKTFGGKTIRKGPRLTGLSGSGLWFYPFQDVPELEMPEFKLVGIMTDDFVDKGFLVANRIDYVSEILHGFFKYPNIPQSYIPANNIEILGGQY